MLHFETQWKKLDLEALYNYQSTNQDKENIRLE